MSIAEHEQRIRALEAAVVELKSKVANGDANRNDNGGDAAISQTEYPLVPAVPPKASKRHKARLSVIQQGRRDLGLSTTEWSTLDLGEASE
jgi:hypothetical protein